MACGWEQLEMLQTPNQDLNKKTIINTKRNKKIILQGMRDLVKIYK